jgi:hypothetical protein
MSHPIKTRVAESATVKRFRGAPSELHAAHPEVAARCTYRVAYIGPWRLEAVYTYTLHADRCMARKKIVESDNSVQLVVSDEV